MRATFGVVLFIAWAILTILWVYDAIHALIEGGPVRRSWRWSRFC